MKLSGFIRAIITSLVIIGSLGAAIRPAMAAPDTEALYSSGGDVCMPLAACGDRSCEPYFGENATNCPADCAPQPPPRTPTPTVTPTPTLRPTATLVPRVVQASSTPAAGETPTPTPTPTLVPTATPQAAVCSLADFDTLPETWQGAYLELSEQSDFTADQAGELLVVSCNTAPSGQVCLPMPQSLLDAVGDDTSEIRLVDCTDQGQCRTLRTVGQQSGGELCFDVGAGSTLSCATGCTLLPQEIRLLRFPELGLGRLPTAVIAPIAAIGLLLVLGGAGMIIFVVRRSRRREA